MARDDQAPFSDDDLFEMARGLILELAKRQHQRELSESFPNLDVSTQKDSPKRAHINQQLAAMLKAYRGTKSDKVKIGEHRRTRITPLLVKLVWLEDYINNLLRFDSFVDVSLVREFHHQINLPIPDNFERQLKRDKSAIEGSYDGSISVGRWHVSKLHNIGPATLKNAAPLWREERKELIADQSMTNPLLFLASRYYYIDGYPAPLAQTIRSILDSILGLPGELVDQLMPLIEGELSESDSKELIAQWAADCYEATVKN